MKRTWWRLQWNDQHHCPGPTPYLRRALGLVLFLPTIIAECRWWGRWRFDIAYLIWHTRHWYDWTIR